MMIHICPSIEQTKEWRLQQSWYFGGKQNECELFQQQCIQQITGHALNMKTNLRLNLTTNTLQHVKAPLLNDDGFEYTEDFDGSMQIHGPTFYFNLKFVCGAGGAQNRTLRETYHFIQSQLEHLLSSAGEEKYFINILDGDGSNRYMPKFHYLLGKDRFQKIRQMVFVGDTHQFQSFWQKFLPNRKMDRKQELGQFYTTNHQYILQNMSIPGHISHIIEPFTGAGDLLNFITDISRYKLECYDIEPKTPNTIRRDTLSDPPCFKDRFVITNPPYLARNKSRDKGVFDKYRVNDLYKCFIKELTHNRSAGGIIIIPLNFWCSKREIDIRLRRQFLKTYRVVQLNIFEEPVFNDTDYSVCSFQFMPHERENDTQHTIRATIFPEKKELQVVLDETNHYMMGGEIFNLQRTHQYSITRLTRLNKPNTNLLVKCIDDEKPIHLSVVSDDNIYTDNTPNLSARSYATLVVEPPLSMTQQQDLADKFNTFLNKYRERYNSLFLSAYREYKRKRIPFDLAYHIVGHLLEKQ